ncbi:MAG: GDSL-type esterase/lipase family protein [Prolixibacteraceae bacterium]
MKRTFILQIFCALFSFISTAQNGQLTWDNPIDKNWPDSFIKTEIKSSADSSLQKAMFYTSTQKNPQPLIVSLHTWSGDYSQEDPLVKEILLRDWNYIHPEFRGVNNKPEACGSDLVVADLEDAIQYAIQNGNVDPGQVHLIGVSGGGFAGLLAFMKINFPVRSFSVYASISNLEDWYWECKGRGLKYAGNIESVTSGGKIFDPVEARKRSPYFMDFQPEKRKGSFLNIYAGIHDGYTGSVPITQSISMFNKLLMDMYPERTADLISDSLKLSLLAKRINPEADSSLAIGGRKIHLIRELPNLNFTLFEGTHEMLVPQALSLIETRTERNSKSYRILTIGDSNGTFDYSWPQQLERLMPFSTVVNRSVSGNTIGFDNLDREDLNTLKNINCYLDEAFAGQGSQNNFDFILINLGTNDTKRIFDARQKEVPENMITLIRMIRKYMEDHQKLIPEICLISPSPMDEHKVNLEKYGGGDLRIQKNNEKFRELAAANRVSFLNTYSVLKPGFSEYTTDGVHLNEKAQFMLAKEISDFLIQK